MYDHTLDKLPSRALLVAVQLPGIEDGALAESLGELRRLAKTLGLEVVGEYTQRRSRFEPATYVGKGKVAELKLLIEGESADTLLVDHEITPSQARNLQKETGAKEVLDRTAVIIEIFHRHARSRAAKAQVEIVRLEYMAPRLREQGEKKDRGRGSGVGRGTGESQMELDRRKLRDRIAELHAELAALAEERSTQRARRSELNRVALVGYTNAGKSTLMRALTGSDVYIADKLFATLDTTVRTLEPPTVPKILVSDTVGFIKQLPHGLVDSFKSTLDEALEASLLVHVVDASDPGFMGQHFVTEEVLSEIGAGAVPRLLVLNKIDRGGDEAALQARFPDALVLSARRPDDVARLYAAIVEFFAKDLVEAELFVAWTRQQLRGEIFAECRVLEERHDEDGTTFRLRAPGPVLDRLRVAAAGGGLPVAVDR